MATPDLPIGTPVLAYPGFRPDDPVLQFAAKARVLDTVTRSNPWQLGHGDWVVAVEGHAGGILLSHVDIKPSEGTTE